jgi:hypothetical protein
LEVGLIWIELAAGLVLLLGGSETPRRVATPS